MSVNIESILTHINRMTVKECAPPQYRTQEGSRENLLKMKRGNSLRQIKTISSWLTNDFKQLPSNT